MKLAFFAVPAEGGMEVAADVNRFLGAHRVVAILGVPQKKGSCEVAFPGLARLQPGIDRCIELAVCSKPKAPRWSVASPGKAPDLSAERLS